ncbi:hypothetical protein [Adhaeretor mobilis]|uniref:Uncharacterized protein n=1 Tax=Adhaeretor mobilis TaxID=1930276 RepID=A0A517MR29_9BACT|nr:hypothetical protein [Adhaeretor mobilis]QDS97335.1 hypothetical protein HG15A2_05960 [Adhaeretor mobilis]
MSNDSDNQRLSPLQREEYVEQHHLFAVLGERMKENMPAQEVLAAVREEVLATTKLPMAIDFLLSELKHTGAFADGMRRLGHYFTPFQCYVMSEAENDKRQFDLRVALEVLAKEAEYRASEATRQGLFIYQLEVLCRNRLGYDQGLDAIAADPSYTSEWAEWIFTVRRQIGLVDLADLLYVRSEFALERNQHLQQSGSPVPILFGIQEGRIAWANRRKDPLLLFAAMHRHLGYPAVPRPANADPEERLLPTLARRVEQMNARIQLLEEEQRGGIDLERFYVKPPAEDAAGDST